MFRRIIKQEDVSIEKETERLLGYEMSATASQVKAVSENLFMMLEENNAITQELFSSAQEVLAHNKVSHSALEETTEEVNNVLEILDEVDQTTDKLTTTSRETSERIEGTLEQVMGVLTSFKAIEKGTQETNQSIKELEETSSEITTILNSVSQISKQTRLLALNASIESARVGEAGKGFAVVAEEIRKLSEDTNQAVQAIQQLIDTFQKALMTVNIRAQSNQQEVRKSVETSGYVEEELSIMGKAFQQVLHSVEHIKVLTKTEVDHARVMEQKLSEVNQMVQISEEEMEKLYGGLEQQSITVRTSQEMGEMLNKSSDELNSVITEYKLDDLSHINKKAVEQYVEQCREMVQEVCCTGAFEDMISVNHQSLLSGLKERYAFIEAIWTNDAKGKFITSIPPAGIANASSREWFQVSMQAETYLSEVYISAISRRPCVTLSAPIYQGEVVVGVIGIDIKIG